MSPGVNGPCNLRLANLRPSVAGAALRRAGVCAWGLLLGCWAPLAVTTNGYASNSLIHSAGTRTPLVLRPTMTVADGKRLVSVAYTVSGGADDSGSITVFRTTESTIGYLGLSTAEIREGEADAGQRPFEGIRVRVVEKDTPAARAGLREGDVLLSADGARLSNPRDFMFLVRYHALDQPLELRVRREAEISDLAIELESRTVLDTDLETLSVPALAEGHAGMYLGEIAGQARGLFFDEHETGVMVLGIQAGSPAFYSDLRRADVVLAANGAPVATPAELDEALGMAAGRRVELRVRRGLDEHVFELSPMRRLPRGFSFTVPIVIEMKKNMERTRFGLGMGLIGNYRRTSSVEGGRHFTQRKWGLLLNLIHYEGAPSSRCFSLLWFIRLRW